MTKKQTKKSTPLQQQRAHTYIVRSLDQAKLLADPLRLRILQAFVDEPRTTKQVAQFLGEKPPKLYRHVEALHRGGLLELKAEKRKRGTIERYLQAVAFQFVIDPALFLSGRPIQEHGDEHVAMMDTIFEMARAELKLLPPHPSSEGLKPLVLRAQMRGSLKNIERMRQGLIDWMESCHDVAKEGHDNKDSIECVATIAFYPAMKKT